MKRPIVYMTIFLCFGIFANFYLENINAFIVFAIGIFLFNVHLCVLNKEKFLMVLYLIFIFGYILTIDNNELLTNREVIINGEVKEVDNNGKYYSLLVTTENVDNKKYNTNILVITSDNNVSIADEIEFKTKLINFDKNKNKSEYIFNKSKNIDYKTYCDEIKVIGTNKNFTYYSNELSEKMGEVYEKVLPQDEANIAKALVLGDKTNVSSDIIALYKENGIIHVLTLSGLHITIISQVLILTLASFRLGNRKNFFVIAFLFAFLFFSGNSVSTERAVLMTATALLAPIFMREYDSISSLYISAFIILVFSPFSLFSLAFILSYLSAFSIIILPDKIEQKYNSMAIKSGNKILTSLISDVKYISPFLSVTIITGIVLLYSYYYIYPYSLFVNICIAVLIAPLIVLSFICGIVGLFSIGIAQFISPSIYYILVLIEAVCRLFDKLPFNEILIGQPSIYLVLLYLIIIYLVFYGEKHKNKLIFVSLIMSIFIMIINMNSINIHMFNKDFNVVCIEDESLVILDEESKSFYGLSKFILSTGNNKSDVIVTNSVDNTLYLQNKDMLGNVYIEKGNKLIKKLEKNGISYTEVNNSEKIEIDGNTYFIDGDNVYIDFPHKSFANIKDSQTIVKTNIQNKVQTDGGYDILIDTNGKMKNVDTDLNEIKITLILDHIFIGEK